MASPVLTRRLRTRDAVSLRMQPELMDADRTHSLSGNIGRGLAEVREALSRGEASTPPVEEEGESGEEGENELRPAVTAVLRREVTHAVLRAVFDALDAQGVALEAMILKPNMVLPGLDCPEQDGIDAVAGATLACLRRTVPAAVAGIAFLSGGQSAELATARTVGELTTLFRAWTLASELGGVVLIPGRPVPPGIETLRQRVRRTSEFERRKRAHRELRYVARREDGS